MFRANDWRNRRRSIRQVHTRRVAAADSDTDLQFDGHRLIGGEMVGGRHVFGIARHKREKIVAPDRHALLFAPDEQINLADNVVRLPCTSIV